MVFGGGGEQLLMGSAPHLCEEGGDGDPLALVDVVQGGTQGLNDGRKTRPCMLGHGSAGEKGQSMQSVHTTHSNNCLKVISRLQKKLYTSTF